MSLQFLHPVTSSLLIERNNLLQNSLRPADLPYSIAQEYPIVLAPESHQFSLCAVDSDNVIGHINLWPRELVCNKTSQHFPVAFIGNVATDAGYRGRGVMKQLMDQTLVEAQRLGICALLLWSDLLEFYQKFGFSSFGSEFRMTFTAESLQSISNGPLQPRWENHKNLTSARLQQLLSIRYPTHFFIRRSKDEFTKYLYIPDSYIVTAGSSKKFTSYAVIGKGYDLAGVIHEWGAMDADAMLALIASILKKTGWDQVTLLAPTTLSVNWSQTLRSYCQTIEVHAMALVRILKDDQAVRAALEQSFIWGLDSI
jgi:predicted acetyltransferase